MKTVHARELSNLKMVAGNETKHPIVIDGGIVKHWVGFGWVNAHKASKTDFKKYPTVIRETSHPHKGPQ